MVQRVSTVAFEGIEARAVDVQVQVAPGLPAFAIVGLPDKAVSEARERVRSALIASGLALPARRITVNLAPADLPKEGSHYDLPIALGLMAAIGAIPPDALSGFTVLGELGLDGSIAPGRGRVAGRDRGQFARGRPDLSRGLRRRSRLGEPGHPDRGGEFADPDRQSFPRHAGAVAAVAQSECAERKHARSARHQGPGKRQARARSRRRRRASPVDDGLARRGQVDARRTAALDPAAAVAVRTAGSLDDRLGRGRNPRRRADRAAAVPLAASFRQHGRPDRRRHARQARRDFAQRITACCSSTNCRNSIRACSIRCASRSKTARSRCPAPITASPIRRVSCWSRR